MRTHLMIATAAIGLACCAGCGAEADDDHDDDPVDVVGLQREGFEIDPASTTPFAPHYMLATRYEHIDDPQYGSFTQYDLLMVEEGASFAGSLLVHWNYGTPNVGVAYPVPVAGADFETPTPRIDRLFFADAAGDVRLDHGTVVYTAVGQDSGALLGIVFDLEFEDGSRFKGKAAAPLEVEIVDQQPPTSDSGSDSQ